MRGICSRSFFGVCLIACAWLHFGAAFGAADTAPVGLEGVPEVVARVDEFEITRRELVRELVSASSRGAAERLVRRMLVDQAAAKTGAKVTPEDLDAQLKVDEINLRNEMRLMPGEVNERTFEELVRTRFQMSLDEYKNMVIRQRLLAERSIGKSLRPTQADLQRFFQHKPYAHRDLTVEEILQPPIRYRASHILITPLNPADLNRGMRFKGRAGEKAELLKRREKLIESKGGKENYEKWLRDQHITIQDDLDLDVEPEWQESLRRAQQVLAEIKSNKITWDQAVEKYTQDPHDMHPMDGAKQLPTQRQKLRLQPGEVGWFTREGPLVDEFYEGAKNMRKKGEIAGPVRTQFGYHIIKLMEDVDIPPRKTFQELVPQVQQIYVNWVLQALTDQWLDTLVKSSNIEVIRPVLWCPDPAVQGEKDEGDPVALKVNGEVIKRSDVWRELLRSDGPEALDRLINRELALGPLKRLGASRLEWEGKPPQSRSAKAPPIKPVEVTVEELDTKLTEERLRLETENAERKKKDPQAAPWTLDQYVRESYGQTLKEFMRGLEAGVVLSKSIRDKTDLDEGRLMFEFYLAQDQYRENISFYVDQIIFRLKPDADQKTRQDFINMAGDLRKEYVEKRKTWADIAALARDPNDPTAGRDESMILSESNEKYPDVYQELAKQNFEKDQVSEPILSRFGVHLIKVVKRIPARTPEFSEVRDRVERDYLRSRAALYIVIWLRSVKNQAKVQRFLFNLDKLEIPDKLPMPNQ